MKDYFFEVCIFIKNFLSMYTYLFFIHSSTICNLDVYKVSI